MADTLGKMRAGKGAVKVVDLAEILTKLLNVLESKTYFNDPVIMTLKALTEGIRQANNGMGPRKAIEVLHKTLGIASDAGQQDSLGPVRTARSLP